MPVAADHVKKERAPGVLESLDQLRADRKKAIAAAVNRKRRKDKNPDRRGKAINVSNRKKKKSK